MYALINLISALLRPLITPIKTNPNSLLNLEQDGALVPGGAVVGALQAMANNASPVFGNFSLTIIPQGLSARTYTGNEMVGGIIQRMSFSPFVSTTDCTDTATNIIAAIPGAVVNQSFPLFVANMGSSALTVAAGTGVTIAGTNSMSGFTARLFLGRITGSNAVTFSGIFSMQLSSTL